METAFPGEEESRHREDKQEVSGIGDTDSPRVMGDRQGGCPLSEGCLIETVAFEREDIVHRKTTCRGDIFLRHGNHRRVIHRCGCSRVILDFGVVEGDGEWQLAASPLIKCEAVGGGRSLSQGQFPLLSGKKGDGGSDEYDKQRQMEPHGGDRHPAAAHYDIGHAAEGCDHPQGNHPGGIIYGGEGGLASGCLLDQSGRDQRQCQQAAGTESEIAQGVAVCH